MSTQSKETSWSNKISTLLTIIVSLIAIFSFIRIASSENWFKRDGLKAFNDDKALKLIILPFDEIGVTESQVEKVLEKKISNLSKEFGVKIITQKGLKFNSKSFDENKAFEIGRKYLADVVIYGDIFKNSTGRFSSFFSYAITDSSLLLSNIFTNSKASDKIQDIELVELVDEYQVKNLDHLLYWLIGLQSYFEGKYEESNRAFSHIYYDLDLKSKLLSLMMLVNRVTIEGFSDTTMVYMEEVVSLSLSQFGEFTDALEFKRVQITPNSWKAHYAYATHLKMNSRKIEKSVEHYRISLGINPNHPEAHLNLGELLYEKGDIDEAKEHFIKAIELDEELWKAYFNLGTLYISQREFTSAVSYLEVSIKNGYNDAYRKLGIAQYFLNQPDASKSNLLKAVKLLPKHVHNQWAYGYLASIYYNNSQLDSGLYYFRRSVSGDIRELEIDGNYLSVLIATDSDEEAVNFLKKIQNSDREYYTELINFLANERNPIN